MLLSPACKSKQKTADQPLRKVKVVLDWTPNTNHTGLYVAQELGYFKAAGLDVEIIQPGQNSAEQIVASGQAQFGISYQESVINARSQQLPLVSLAAVIQHNTSGFASLKNAGITRPKDFAGKRYGSSGWPSEKEILRTVMTADSSSFDKVKVIEGITDFFSTIGRDADFEWIYYGWDGVEAKRRGIDINFIYLKDLNPVFDYYTPVLITGSKIIEADPEFVRSFMGAVSKGYQLCASDPVKAGEILLKRVPELATNPEQIKLSLEYLKDQFIADAPRWGEQKLSTWQNLVDWMFSRRLLDTGMKADGMFTNEYLPL
jgi:ABC-type nitrate/sulfonate/bicarbonate transport system substrate-binding protein